MKDVLLTSSALILALLILRQLFRRRISRRAQYALWLLVLVRLLVPVSLPAADFSLLTAAEPVVQQLETEQSLYLSPIRETVIGPEDGEPLKNVPAPTAPVAVGRSSPDNTHVFTDGNDVVHQVEYQKQLDLTDLLRDIWYVGMAVMALWLLMTNLRFHHKLRKARTPYKVEGCKYPVYLVETGLTSPCLFGLIHPAIYLTPAAASTPERLRHVIAHESAHARHGDPLWALLRGVCLTVYWFDPLVWLAAVVSRADGELACDEAALSALGTAERVSYGQTLLSLIPVRRGSGDPLLSATTMTAGKRQLKERIARIAEARQTRSAALFAVLALAAVVCAVTFTDSRSQGPSQPLSSQELEWFNEEFFNQSTSPCLPNQFLTSLYDSPQEIDLYELFYNGTGEPESIDQAERQAAAEAIGGEDSTDLVKFSAANADRVLETYTGLTLDQTEQIGLDRFTYLEETDAYYHFHGDTNAVAAVFTAGTRQGDTVRLYYDAYGSFLGGELAESWACLTLKDRGDGTYWFVSHQLCDMPAIPTAYPDWEAVLTLPVSELTPYEPETAEVTVRTGDVAQEQDFYFGEQVSVEIYRSSDGNLYAAYAPDSALPASGYGEDMNCFFTFPEEAEDITLGGFRNVLGHDGVVISYTARMPESHDCETVSDYYIFDDGLFSGGSPALLARAYGTVTYTDLDGDGETELCAASDSTAQLFFRRDGALYQADLAAMLRSAWPEAGDLSFDRWDAADRYLSLTAQVPLEGTEGQTASAFRWVYFDGDSFLVYRREWTVTDHVVQGVSAPAEVLEQAKAYVQGLYETPSEGYRMEDGEFVSVPVEYDDWRILSLTGPFYEEVAGLQVEIWRLNYELHTPTPEFVSLAGNRYVTENGWVSAGYPDCDYFYFRLEENGERTFLFQMMESDCAPGSELFRSDLISALSELGVISLADLPGQTLLEIMEVHPVAFLERLTNRSVWEQARAIASLAQAAAQEPERFESCARYIDSYDRDQNLGDAAKEAWAVLCSTVDSWAAGGRTLTNSRLGLSLQVPAGWDGLAEVFAGGSGLPEQVFSLYEKTAYHASLGMGMVWTLTAYTQESFRKTWPDADGSEILSASSYVIGSDQNYVYLLTTPTDVQFLEEDLFSQTAYETLKVQSQQVLEDFLVRNDIAPNPLCPDADGCYRYTGSVVVTPEKPPAETATAAPTKLPTDSDIRAALMADYIQGDPPTETEDTLIYQTEAHKILAQESSDSVCTFYLVAWRGTFALRDGAYEMTSGNRIPTALTYTWDGGAWQLSEYWTPGDGEAYARDLREKFPPEAAEQELNADSLSAISQELMDQCRQDAVRYFTRVTGSTPQRRFPLSEVEFTDRALETEQDPLTYDERQEWVQAAELEVGSDRLPLGDYRTSGGNLAYAVRVVDTSLQDQYVQVLRFADGTLADLPLPMDSDQATALPDSAEFRGGRFLYTVTFPSQVLTNDERDLLHLRGTYRYEVDLDRKTVSLTVVEG